MSTEDCEAKGDGVSGTRKSNFPLKIAELLANSEFQGGLDFIQWNDNGTGIIIQSLKLDAYLKSDESIFPTRNLKSFVRQLNFFGFENVTSQEKIRTNQNFDDDVMVFEHQNFLKNCPNLVMTIDRTDARKQTKYIYCKTDKNYLKYKRQNDPCFKIMPKMNGFDRARGNLRAVMEKQKLGRTIANKLAMNPNKGFYEVISNFIANEKETKNPIQMGAIAGYYGESVIEEDLVKFFGKHLPMYKPISEVVDSITPSISSKIQSSNFVWRNDDPLNPNNAAVVGQQPLLDPVPSSSTSSAAIDPSSDITFEYVSFRDKKQVLQVDAKQQLEKAKKTQVMIAESQSLVNERRHRDEFISMAVSEEEEALKHINQDKNQYLENGMPQFANSFLDSNYYDNSNEDGIYSELRNAIDLIMN